jgi:prepilin-type processing-associated H-X9-DG protein
MTIPSPRISRAALASALLGLASIPLLALAGIPALYLGVLGLREVNASDGAVRGRWLALAGLFLGGLGTTATVLGLAAILVIQMGRSNQRAECVDHLRRIGVGLARYHEQNGHFPPAGIPAPGLASEDRPSWMAGIVPYLGEGKSVRTFENLANRLDLTRAWNDPANAAVLQTPLRLVQCPATPDFDPRRTPTPTSYVGLAGIDPEALALPRTSPRAGVFGYDRGVAQEEMTAGTAQTMMVVETAWQNGPWLASGPATARGLDPSVEQYIGPGRPFGGLHTGGMNVLWGDSSVRWVSDQVDPRVFRRQATLSGSGGAP